MNDILNQLISSLSEDEHIKIETTSKEDLSTITINFLGVNVLLCGITSKFILVESPFSLDSSVTFGNTMIYDLSAAKEVSLVLKDLCNSIKVKYRHFEEYRDSVLCTSQNLTEFSYPSNSLTSITDVKLTVRGFSINVSFNDSLSLSEDELQLLDVYSSKLETPIVISSLSSSNIKSLSKINCFS